MSFSLSCFFIYFLLVNVVGTVSIVLLNLSVENIYSGLGNLHYVWLLMIIYFFTTDALFKSGYFSNEKVLGIELILKFIILKEICFKPNSNL